MKSLLLALAALAVLGGAALLLLSSGSPGTGPGAEGADPVLPAGDDRPESGAVNLTTASSASGRWTTSGAGPGSLHGPSPAQPGGGFRPPQPPREGAPPGEILKPDLPEAEAKEVEETRRTLMETDLGKVEWRGRTLKSVAEEIASKSGIPVVLEGDDIADEPVQMGGESVSARAALDHIAGSRTLRFEVQPGKVVIRR